jgi:hypothetical protein
VRLARCAPLASLALLISACGPTYSLDCGPLARPACVARAQQIVSIIKRNFPDRTVSSIRIDNRAGEALVILDDGSEVAFGHREAAYSN